MAVTSDPEHKFELALGLGELKVAYELAKEAQVHFVGKSWASNTDDASPQELLTSCLTRFNTFSPNR